MEAGEKNQPKGHFGEVTALEALGGHWQLHKSFELIEECFPKEYARPFMIADIGLNLLGDGIKQPWDGKGEDPRRLFLEIGEAAFHAGMPSSYTEVKEKLEGNHPWDVLIPKPGEEITERHAQDIMQAFYSLYDKGAFYSPHDNKEFDRVNFTKDLLGEFVDGLRMKLDKEGGLFTQEELEDYYRRVQCAPTLLCLNAAVDLKTALPKNITYGELYDSINDISQGVKIIKKCRESDILDGLERNLIYFSEDDLNDAKLRRKEFVDIATAGKYDGRMKELIRNNVHKANAYFRRGVETLMKLPSEGVWAGVQKFAAAYGGLIKHWADELGRAGYNPLNGKGYMNPEQEDVDNKILALAGSVDRGEKQGIKDYILDWYGLDAGLLDKMGERIGYGK